MAQNADTRRSHYIELLRTSKLAHVLTTGLTEEDLKLTKVVTEYEEDASECFNRDMWLVVKPIVIPHKDYYVLIPNGYLTDGTSSPRFAKPFLGTWGAHGRESVGHDVLCDYAHAYRDGKFFRLSDTEINEFYRDRLRIVGFAKWRANVIYGMVQAYAFVIGGFGLNTSKHNAAMNLAARAKK